MFNTIKSNKKLLRIGSHILFWISYFVFILIQVTFLKEVPSYFDVALRLLLTLPVDIFATYFTVYILLPKLLFKKKHYLFILFLILSGIVFILLQRIILYYITYPLFYADYLENYTFFRFNYFYSFVNIYMVAGFFMAIKLLKYWYENQSIRMELESQNKNSEIALLRNQINPHFLFNTLNNIDSLIMDNQEQASDSIIKLSEIMRYMLYDSNTQYVPLSKEINYLKSYISLQKIRLKDTDYVKMEIKGDHKNKLIAPMLLVPFVENAFKHGSKKVISPGVSITLTTGKNFLEFIVINYTSESDLTSKDVTKGIGMNNVRRRLELIYKNQYHLDINSKNDKFIVKLRLNFNEN
ncbi:MAG: histidine kinase [Bacteroidales bacterium]|nr:histidine kinase [Bacteroidales bacterium]